MNRHQLHSLLVLFLLSSFTHMYLANKISQAIYSTMPLYINESPLTLWLHNDIEACKEVFITPDWSIYSKTTSSYVSSYNMWFVWVLAQIAYCHISKSWKLQYFISMCLPVWQDSLLKKKKVTSVCQNFSFTTSVLPLLRTS